MNSIYSKADPFLLKLFEEAGNLRKVLCAPLDFAKQSHAVMFCNGLGDILKKPFNIPNSSEGVEKLVAEISATCRHRHIKKQHVFLGGEDTPSYADNFVASLHKQGFRVTRVNAGEAKKHRENLHASTDFLDLNGIAHCLLKGRAKVLAQAPEIHRQLRLLVRERHFLVESQTAARNRLHTHVDRLFPGFLSYKQSRIKPFGLACYWLLEHRFSAPQIARRDVQKLAEGLEKHRVSQPHETAAHLRQFAARALPPQPDLIPASQCSLQSLLIIIQALEQAIAALAPTKARPLASPPSRALA